MARKINPKHNVYILILDENVLLVVKGSKNNYIKALCEYREALEKRNILFHLTLVRVNKQTNQITILRKAWKRKDKIDHVKTIKLAVRDILLKNNLKSTIMPCSWMVEINGRREIINHVCKSKEQLIDMIKSNFCNNDVYIRVIETLSYIYVPQRYRGHSVNNWNVLKHLMDKFQLTV